MKKKMSIFEDVLKQKAEDARKAIGFMPLDQIPQEIKLKWLSDEYKKDKQQRECLYVTFVAEDGQKIQQKYTQSMFSALAEDIETIGGYEKLKNDFFLYRKKEVGKKGSYQRLYPVAEASRRKK